MLKNPYRTRSSAGRLIASPMTFYTLRTRLAELGMLMSYSRPRVRNHNPYSEALFRTVKYCPKWPAKGFKTLQEVQNWMLDFEL